MEEVVRSEESLALELVQAMYFDLGLDIGDSPMLAGPEDLYRVQGKSGRLYAAIRGDRLAVVPSATTLVRNAMPTGYALLNWLRSTPEEQSMRITQEAMDYGSAMHRLIADLSRSGSLSSEQIHGHCLWSAERASKAYGYGYNVSEWREGLSKAMLSFNQFCLDYEVKVMGVEIPLLSERVGAAGTMDLLVSMNEKLYTEATPAEKRKRVFAIVDAKKRYPDKVEYTVQLAIYQKLWADSMYGHAIPVTRLFAWSPKDWSKTPSYELVNHTDDAADFPLEEWMVFAKHMSSTEPKKVLVTGSGILFGKIGDEDFRWSDTIRELANRVIG